MLAYSLLWELKWKPLIIIWYHLPFFPKWQPTFREKKERKNIKIKRRRRRRKQFGSNLRIPDRVSVLDSCMVYIISAWRHSIPFRQRSQQQGGSRWPCWTLGLRLRRTLLFASGSIRHLFLIQSSDVCWDSYTLWFVLRLLLLLLSWFYYFMWVS